MPMMAGMMVCAVVVVCANKAHNVMRLFSRDVSYTRRSRQVSMNIDRSLGSLFEQATEAKQTIHEITRTNTKSR